MNNTWEQPAGDEATGPVSWTPVDPVFEQAFAPCPDCGGTIDLDGYCQQCGAKSADPRDHLEIATSERLAGACDRGLLHTTNEDALAIGTVDEVDVLVCCDGVSSADDSASAALQASRAAVDALTQDSGWTQFPATSQQMAEVMALATSEANAAVLAASDLEAPNPASCTIVIGARIGNTVVASHLGDSRAYWVPDEGSALLMTVDDSMAAERIGLGADRHDAETSADAHVITRWLGRDAPNLVPHVSTHQADGPGWFVVCTDGLWNYMSDPAEMAAAVRQATVDASAIEAARHLVSVANGFGGHDNITVALVRVDGAQEILDAPTKRVARREEG